MDNQAKREAVSEVEDLLHRALAMLDESGQHLAAAHVAQALEKLVSLEPA